MKKQQLLCLNFVLLVSFAIADERDFISDMLKAVPMFRTFMPNSNEYCKSSIIECYSNGNIRSIKIKNVHLNRKIPRSIQELTRLTVLELENCSVRIDWNSISKLHFLRVLKLNNNLIRGKIPTFNANLVELDLSYNLLTGLPESFPSTLYRLNISNNKIEGSLDSIHFNNEYLTEFHAGNNNLTGSISKHISNLPRLHKLNLSKNNIHDDISELKPIISNLVELDLSCNRVYGDIPTHIFWLRNINVVNLSRNMITGYLRAETYISRSHTIIDLSHNLIEGEVPNFLGIYNLKVLRLNNNKLKNICNDSKFFGTQLIEGECLMYGNNFHTECISAYCEYKSPTSTGYLGH
ncbi:uncharacterized protein LOC126322607 isoform X1 [Schistocerca gregaria]|uniref:uncharacterized protein LOC126322607 isoform X1 n=1 Tax=Schistocerca gregaria TaxID=7010 RepID=UPI00211E9476|nr:uncharacterized protein LOC126322607 isoform X1 [Schistocerca gregaria]XP_049850441.1 uncharacterized protein LOC126322607 isoform X1 [Schistocerca gregaria]